MCELYWIKCCEIDSLFLLLSFSLLSPRSLSLSLFFFLFFLSFFFFFSCFLSFFLSFFVLDCT